MQKLLQVWQLIRKSLQETIPVMLLYVVESNGSSPGRQGFCMAVNADGAMEGSIGGGIMEHKFVELAKEQLKEQATKDKQQKGLLKKQVHDKSSGTNQSGMICSGEQTILLYPVKQQDKETVELLIASLEQYKNGTVQLSSQGLSFSTAIPATDYYFSMTENNEWVYKEKTGYKNHLYIVGGGHCALALSKLMREMDFYITLYEEREELYTVSQNKYAHEIIIVEDYTALGFHIANGRNQYVVIMTFGYRSDDMAIRSLLDKQFTYFGVLGSKKKMEELFTTYRDEGIQENLLQRINTPIGLAINSKTPEEIAVSIAAQIIQVKNQSI
jgi:xanthine dehydrogenase accessory factor